MTRAEVTFWSHGCLLAGTLMLPDGPAGHRRPAIVQGPGWLGLRDAKLYAPYHDALLSAGFAVLTIDYRGFGGSQGDASYLDPQDQVEDLRAALDYLETREDIDARRIGAFGSGGTGGGNAILLAARDERVGAVVSQVPVADGREWLRRCRREHEWLDFLARIEADRHRRAVEGSGEMVSAREELLLPTPERRATAVKRDVDSRVPERVQLASAEAIFAYRPVDEVARIAPRAVMLIAVAGDAVTPEDHARALYEAAGGPKALVIQTGTSHYAAYARYRSLVTPLIVDWFDRYLTNGEVVVHEEAAGSGIRYLSRA